LEEGALTQIPGEYTTPEKTKISYWYYKDLDLFILKCIVKHHGVQYPTPFILFCDTGGQNIPFCSEDGAL
jgi:hypothetical protein